MAIKPILFNTEMVRAILDGRKSCTRRLVKTRRKDACGFYVTKKADGTFSGIYEYDENESMFDNPLMPPYQPGDILYVRETWGEWTDGYVYKAWNSPFLQAGVSSGVKWHPSIHMPKEAARIWLKVTDVRVERLQEMEHEDAEKEGANEKVDPKTKFRESALLSFSRIWDSTIKKSDLDRYGWNANPRVWVIEFERCEKPQEV